MIKPKKKKCKVCGYVFVVRNSMIAECSIACQRVSHAKKEAKKKELEWKKRKEAARPLKFYKDKAKNACHAYIRFRDRELPCISCGTTADVQYAAGHYMPSGVNAVLRYDERNIHKQCNRYCNKGMSGNLIHYRKNLILKIGLETVEELENDKREKKYTKEELLQIELTYKQKLKALKAECDL